ncbi:NAD(P)-dependent alcohol dehydrogenase [Micromonospora cathayae]|uniref:NAD(P)-dependent alcohol dehydrogenase n=1 Tax=Micromonospora cathayae TaxID=3028804 RepID=A0ABY7ZU50_9ACTN|nr:NAD(P)-dependent alcohol dehydrogenase [Micromonospora sp. HUAS 3]WDZ86586.1 NAD(P)-dependent alcohol dehydrogenase [Micromonospora sp. HUAS 3]
MRAAVIDRYGTPDVVRITDVPTPTPRADEVLVRVVATAVTAADSRIRAARFPKGFAPFARLAFGASRPRRTILGGVFSGRVEAVGATVTGLSPGDEVCGMTGVRLGAHAQYVVVPAKRIVRKPAKVTHEDAAGVLFGGTTALYFLRDRAAVRPGQSVLVNGASGAIGTNAVQLARHFGASVTAVTSTRNNRLVTELGADRVIDYTTTDLADVPDRFDVVLDTVGNLSPASGRRLLTDKGVLLLAAADLWATVRARGAVKAGAAPERVEDIELLLLMVADGELSAVVDRVCDLDGIAAAHQRVDSGRKVGNIIVRP